MQLRLLMVGIRGQVYLQSHRIDTIPVDPPDDTNDGQHFKSK